MYSARNNHIPGTLEFNERSSVSLFHKTYAVPAVIFLVAAGLLSVIVFPAIALQLLREDVVDVTEPARTTCQAVVPL